MAHRDNSDCALAGCCLLQACGYWGRWCNPRNYHRCWLVCHLLSRAVCRVHCSLHFRPSPPNCWATCFSASRNRWSYSLHSGFRAPRWRLPNTLTPPIQTNRTLCTAFLLQTCIFFLSRRRSFACNCHHTFKGHVGQAQRFYIAYYPR